MGKGQRAREARAGKKEELRAIAAKRKLRSKIKKIIGLSAAALVAVAIVVVVIYTSIASTGYFLRNTVALKTENYQVDNAMLTYYLKTRYYNTINDEGDYLKMLGLDTTKSLKSQSYGDGTWFELFLSQAKQQAKETLLCAEKAKAEGYELTEEDNKAIEDVMAGFKAEAESYKVSIDNYYNSVFGQGIKEEDVLRAVTLSQLATKYYDDYMDSLEYTDEKLNEHFDKNKSDFVKADYLKLELDNEYLNNAEEAEKIAEAKNEKEFREAVKNYYRESLIIDRKEELRDERDEPDEVVIELEESHWDDINTKLEAYAPNLEATSNMPSGTTEDELLKWLFEDGRKAGDTKVITTTEKEDGEDSEEKTVHTVYFVTNPYYYDDYNVQSIRHIMFTKDKYETTEAAKAKAEEVLKLYNEAPSEEKFIELVKQYSEDEATVDNGGLYEQVTKSTTEWPENLVNWAFGERKAGEVEIIEIDEGYHIMYYVGSGDILWKINARNALQTDDYSKFIDELEKTYAPVIKDKAAAKISA